MYRDSSAAPLLDLRRRLKAVMDVLHAKIRDGVSLAAQWNEILGVGRVNPVTREDFQSLKVVVLASLLVLWEIFIVGFLISSIGSLCIGGRKLFEGGGSGCVRIPCFALTSGSSLIWCLSAPFLQCKPHLTPGGSGVLADPARIDEKFRKAWLAYFCRSGQWDTSLEEFDREVDGWLPLLPEVSLPRCLLMLFSVKAFLLVALMGGVGGS